MTAAVRSTRSSSRSPARTAAVADVSLGCCGGSATVDTVTYGTAWTDQWDRLLRWRERVRRARDDWQNSGMGTEHFLDDLFATFQALWHLKDWLHNDPHSGVTGKDVDDWVNSRNSILLVAADLANGSKHLVLTNRRAGGSHQTRKDVRVHVGHGVQTTFYALDGRSETEWEAVTLADACIEEWREFIAEAGLSVPSSGAGAERDEG